MELKLIDFFKYTDKELKKLLGTTKNITNNFFIVEKFLTDPNIYKLMYRTKNEGVIQYKSPIIRLYNYERFNYDKFSELKCKYLSNKYRPKSAKNLTKILTHIMTNYNNDEFEITYDQDHVELTLYYPEITITNKLESSHIMRDVYVRYSIYIDKERMNLSGISLFRGTLTMGEYKENYMFSHLGNDTNIGFTENYFCFGDDTELNKLKNAYYNNISYNDILPFTIMIKEYLRWESLDGVPFKHIDKIKEFKINYTDGAISNDVLLKAYDYVLNNIDNFHFKSILEDNKEKIIFPQNTENRIIRLVMEYIKINNPELIIKQIGDECGIISLYTDKEVKTINDELTNRNGIFFKGKHINTKIKNYTVDINKINNRYPDTINNESKYQIINMLKRDFHEYLILLKNNLL